MKKAITLFITMALLLALLSSCEMFVPDPTERPSHWWGDAEPTGSADPTGSAEPSPSQAGWQEGSGTDFDRRFIQRDICTTGDTVYFSSGNLIYYADKATGICLPLCGKPECTHNDENCNAYAPGGMYSGLNNYNGRLCWIGREGTWLTGGGQWYIFSMAYDGTDRRMVKEVTYDGMILQAQFHRGYLYRNWLTQDVINGAAKQVICVEAYPLEGGGDGLVILRAEEVVDNGLRIQAYGDYVYIAFEAEDSAFDLYRWDTRVGVLETLYRGTVPFNWGKQFWVMEDGILFGSREFTGPDEDPEASWEYALYRFSFETAGFEPVNRLRLSEGTYTNVIMSDGLVIANWWDTDSDGIRVLVKDFAGQTVLDAAFEDVEWYFAPTAAMTGYGVDESYLYFNLWGIQCIAVSRDGSEIRLLWSEDA